MKFYLLVPLYNSINLFDLILRFHDHYITFTMEIKKIYGQILINPDDENY